MLPTGALCLTFKNLGIDQNEQLLFVLRSESRFMKWHKDILSSACILKREEERKVITNMISSQNCVCTSDVQDSHGCNDVCALFTY